MTRGTLVIFAKAPRAGLVKTRLARDIGPVPALVVSRRLLHATVRRLAPDRRWRTVVAISPDCAAGRGAGLPRPVATMPQGGGHLGRRMLCAAARFASGPVVIVGSDIPGLERHHVTVAFRFLRGHDVVIGPAEDGGYWLIGFRARLAMPRTLDDVRWSGAHALTDTLKALDPAVRVAFLERLRDIDTVADLVATGFSVP